MHSLSHGEVWHCNERGFGKKEDAQVNKADLQVISSSVSDCLSLCSGRKEEQRLRVPVACVAQTPLDLPIKSASPERKPVTSPKPFPTTPLPQDAAWFDPAEKMKV